MSKTVMFPEVVHDFYKPTGNREDHVFNTTGPSLTRQEFAEECDINVLMSKYDAHVIGGPGGLSPQQMYYADFTQMPGSLLEYHTFMDNAQAAFMTLPAVVRKEFDNDATLFVEFASDPENLGQMRTWGLAPPAKAPEKAAEALSVPAPGGAGGAAPAPPVPPQAASTHGST